MDKLARLHAFLDSDPDDLFTRFAIAMEHIKAGEHSDAVQWLTDVTDRDPEYLGAYYHLGKCLEHIQEPEAARQAYIRGLEQARLSGDTHSAAELAAALQEID